MVLFGSGCVGVAGFLFGIFLCVFYTNCYFCSIPSLLFKQRGGSLVFNVFYFPAVQRYYSRISSAFLFNAEKQRATTWFTLCACLQLLCVFEE